jgi:hypothetical protein
VHEIPVFGAGDAIASPSERFGAAADRHESLIWWSDDWQAFLQTRANLLVTGRDAALRAFLRVARPLLLAPIRSVAGDQPLALGPTNTLIVRHIDRLSHAAQARLLAWLNRPEQSGTQIVSTSSAPLFQLVRAGGFDHDLYYRLNTILLKFQELPYVSGAC